MIPLFIPMFKTNPYKLHVLIISTIPSPFMKALQKDIRTNIHSFQKNTPQHTPFKSNRMSLFLFYLYLFVFQFCIVSNALPNLLLSGMFSLHVNKTNQLFLDNIQQLENWFKCQCLIFCHPDFYIHFNIFYIQ